MYRSNMVDRIVIRNTSILNVNKLEFTKNQTLVIENKKISWVGNTGDYQQKEADNIINGEGKFAIPGMMDLHVHLDMGHSWVLEPHKTLFRHRDTYRAFDALKNAQQYLRYGFTTLRGCGSSTDLASLQAFFDDAIVPGPRLRLATKTITQPGNQQLYGPQLYVDGTKDEFVKPGIDGVIAAVRDRKANGASHIKTTTTGGVLHGQDSKVELSLWRPEELEAMVSEAERLGMYVCAHAHTPVGIMAAVKAGVRSIEHSTVLTDEIIDEMLKRGTFIVATQSAGTYILDAPESAKKGFPQEVIKKWETVSSQMIQSHRKAFEKGVPIACGTDAPVAADHCHTPKELRLLVEHIGMTPLQAIQAATLTAARVIRMEDELGSLEVGKYADVVILDKDPTNDIAIFEDTESYCHVIKDGKIVSEKGRLIHNY